MAFATRSDAVLISEIIKVPSVSLRHQGSIIDYLSLWRGTGVDRREGGREGRREGRCWGLGGRISFFFLI